MMEIGFPEEEDLIGVKKLWDLIKERLCSMDLDPTSVSIYQDSLSAQLKNNAVKNLADLAARGSRNAEILTDLVQKGVELENTESSWRLTLHFLGSILPPKRCSRFLSPYTIHYRDKYIAKEINKTLMEGKTGLLFIGTAHTYFARYIAPDIVVKNLVTYQEISELIPELGWLI